MNKFTVCMVSLNVKLVLDCKDGTSVLDACLQRNVVNESVLGKQARLSKFLELHG